MDHTQQTNAPPGESYAPPPYQPLSGDFESGQHGQVSLSGLNIHDQSSTHPEQYHGSGALPPPPPVPSSQPIADHSTAFEKQPNSKFVEESMTEEEQAPPLPQRPSRSPGVADAGYYAPEKQDSYNPPLPPRRIPQNFGDDDPSNPIHYTRDPHKLIAYLIPFPRPAISGQDPSNIPMRFMIYTPPPPPLTKPGEGDKEGKLHKVQRKWQEEVRSAKLSTAKTASWQGIKSKATRGINKAMEYTTSSNLDFLGRMSDHKSDSEDSGKDLQGAEGKPTKKTVGVEELVLIHPTTMGLDQQQMRAEFVNTMLRTKTKAQRDTIIATGLLPVTYGIDILATLIWPFGGLGEIDTVWAYASFRGAKTARSVTKRLESSAVEGTDPSQDSTLKLVFTPSARLEVLRRYLQAECNKADSKLFPGYSAPPTETDVLQAIGWHPSQSGGESRNWEDEQWEMTEVKDDLKTVMHKAAKEWKKWCLAYEKNPEKALKK